MGRVLALFLTASLCASAAIDDWENLKSLRPGERVWIIHREGTTERHRKAVASSWAPDSLTVRYKNRDVTIPRTDLRRVSTYAGKSRGKGAGYGALVGAAAGAATFGALALTDADLDVSPALVVAAGALWFSGIGAVVGLVIGATKTQTIYKANIP